MFSKLLQFKPATIASLVALLLIAGLFFFLGKNKKAFKWNTRVIVYGSICIALSFVLSYIRLYRFPQGGSITPGSMLPMFVFSVVFGPIAGVLAGFVYGILQIIQDAYVVHWAQLLLDYPLAFGALGLAGLYRKNLGVSSFIGGFGRFVMHFLSGVIFFGEYAPEGMNVYLYSLMVNGLVIGTDTLICVVLSLIPQLNQSVKMLQQSVAVKQ